MEPIQPNVIDEYMTNINATQIVILYALVHLDESCVKVAQDYEIDIQQVFRLINDYNSHRNHKRFQDGYLLKRVMSAKRAHDLYTQLKAVYEKPSQPS